MLDFFIPLISSFLDSGFWVSYLLPLFVMFFLATVPALLLYIVR